MDVQAEAWREAATLTRWGVNNVHREESGAKASGHRDDSDRVD